MSWKPNNDLFCGLIKLISSLFNTETVGELLIDLSNWFHPHTVLEISMREPIGAFSIGFVYVSSTQIDEKYVPVVSQSIRIKISDYCEAYKSDRDVYTTSCNKEFPSQVFRTVYQC